MKKVTLFAVGMALMSTNANAVITTFAQFNAVGGAPNVRWVNNGAASNTSSSSTSTGSGGYFYTTSTGTSRVPGNVAVKFEFLQAQLSGLGPINANFFMNITVASGNPASAQGAFRIQDIPSGAFSFTSTDAVTVGNTLYSAGSNLLTGTFTSGTIFGTQTSGSFSGNSESGTLSYTSDFLDFSNTQDRDYSMSLTSVTPSFFRGNANRSLRTFRALSTGSFSSDPAPLVTAVVPEPGQWALMIAGFGLVGAMSRRRARSSVVTA